MKTLKSNISANLQSKKTNFKIFNFPLIAIGLIILSNPLLGLIDFFPDFLGYFCLMLGLDGIKRLNGDIEYGVKKLKYLCVTSVAFFVLMFYIFKMDSSWDLTLTFSYMVISVILGVTACNDIFTGVDYCTDRHAHEGFPSVFEAKTMTKLYIVVKAVLVVIPKLYALIEVEAISEFSADIDYASILATENYAILVCFALSAFLGIAWLRYVLKYCIAFKNDKALNQKLLDMYCEDYSKDGEPINFFNINFGSGLILASHVFIFDFVMNTVHFLPEFLSVLVSLLGVFVIRKYIKVKACLKYSVLAFVFQIAIFYYRNRFIENVIFETWDITVTHLIISSILVIGYVAFTYVYFSTLHEITSSSYETMFGQKLTEVYQWGDIFLLVALAFSGANVICVAWRPYFVPFMILSLFIAVYHYLKLYTKFDSSR